MALNPQQQMFKEGWKNPNSPTFGNATASAIAAGYDDEYAKTIVSPAVGNEWVQEIVRDYKRLEKAEEALDEALNLSIDKKKSKHVDTNILDKKTKVAMFVAKGMAKQKYGERKEVDVTSGGKPISQLISDLDD